MGFSATEGGENPRKYCRCAGLNLGQFHFAFRTGREPTTTQITNIAQSKRRALSDGAAWPLLTPPTMCPTPVYAAQITYFYDLEIATRAPLHDQRQIHLWY